MEHRINLGSLIVEVQAIVITFLIAQHGVGQDCLLCVAGIRSYFTLRLRKNMSRWSRKGSERQKATFLSNIDKDYEALVKDKVDSSVKSTKECQTWRLGSFWIDGYALYLAVQWIDYTPYLVVQYMLMCFPKWISKKKKKIEFRSYC